MLVSKRLKCEITKGMFSDEFTVTVKDVAGSPIVVFVPASKVSKESSTVIVGAFQRGDKMFAVLPDERHTYLPVVEGDLQPA